MAGMNSSSVGITKFKVGGVQPSDTPLKRKRGIFHKDLQHMMYGYGDDPNPLPETVALMEDIVVEFITDTVHKAQDVASKRGKLLTEDFLFLLRKITEFGSAMTYAKKVDITLGWNLRCPHMHQMSEWSGCNAFKESGKPP